VKTVNQLKFQNISLLHVALIKKAWMTTKIFEEWLTDLKQMMKKENWKILLFVDNTTCHH
jgi:hypothetical protein